MQTNSCFLLVGANLKFQKSPQFLRDDGVRTVVWLKLILLCGYGMPMQGNLRDARASRVEVLISNHLPDFTVLVMTDIILMFGTVHIYFQTDVFIRPFSHRELDN